MSRIDRAPRSLVAALPLFCLVWVGVSSASPAGTSGTAPADADRPGGVEEEIVQGVRAVTPFDPTGERGILPEPPMMPGWPQVMGTHPNYKPVGVVLADVDGDRDLEILAGSTDNLFRVWHHDGTPMPGWPVNLWSQIQSKAAVADLDQDGDLEILVSVKNGQLHILHHDGTPVAGWPRPSGVSYGFLSPTVYDLDDDGISEVMIGGGSEVRAWRADGSTMPGFPRPTAGNVTGTLAVGDITGDGRPEILAVSLSGFLQAYQVDGTVPPGWPVNFGLSNSWAAPSTGDLDGDGLREALVVGYAFGSYTRIFAVRGDGTALPGFPVTYGSLQTYSCPVIGDADGDGDLELWNAGKINGPTFYAWDHTGAILPGWPAPADPNMEGSAILVDFDGIPGMEAAVGDNLNPGVIFGYNLDGSVAVDFPVSKPGASGPNAPEVGDVDGDGDLDMAMTMTTGHVGLWDFPTPYDPGAVEWGGLFHDNWNTNQHGFVVPGGPASVDGGTAGPLFRLGPVWPNPGDADRTISFATARGGVVQLLVHDATGSRIRSLVDGVVPAGSHTIRWDGRDERGRPVAQGVYFVRLIGPTAGSRTARVVMMR